VTTEVDIVNRALQAMGSRTNITSLSETSNEAFNANLILHTTRDQLTRMAPWNCVTKIAPLPYITSIAGTPENPASGPPLWAPGQPAPPWAYEYQYPVDCQRARYIIPQYTTLAGGVPVYPPGTVTGSMTVGWSGPALKFDIATDTFFGAIAAAVVAGGTGYVVGDILTLPQPTFNLVQGAFTYPMPVGSPAQVTVSTVGGSGAVTGLTIVNDVYGSTGIGGSYFAPVTGTQTPTGGTGTGATVSLTYNTGAPQRVVLCNQETAILCYNQTITDPNVMDLHFQEAWVNILGAKLCFQLSGDKTLANSLINLTNVVINEARKSDGNEGITVNDVTPDFMRVRGNWGGPNWEYSPNMGFDWGSNYSPY
jgi:hypothetical protein